MKYRGRGVACGWYGIQTWFGGSMIYTLLGVMMGHPIGGDNIAGLGINGAQLLCFLAFWAIQFWYILHGIEARALALRDSQPPGEVMTIADTAADIELPMERPLYTPAIKPLIANIKLESGDTDLDATALFSQVVIDKTMLARHIRHALQDRSQITLRELCELQPLQHGLAELVAYLQLASDAFKSVVDEAATETIVWSRAGTDGKQQMKRASLPRVIFVR